MSEEVSIYGDEPTYIVEAPKTSIRIKVKKLRPDAVIPTKAYPTDAGFDLTAVWSGWSNTHKVFEYGFGLSFEIPEGYVGLIFPRSSIYRKDLFLTNCVGVIDAHYRGEVTAKFKSTTDSIPDSYNVGERVAQLVLMPIPQVSFVETDELSETDRGSGGYGSTGI